MHLWKLGGLNPTFKEFTEKYPKKTMIGMAWGFYWRLMVFILALELIAVGVFFIGSLILENWM